MPILISCAQVSVCVLAIVSLVLGILSSYILYQAEEEKRRDLLDNAFGTHLSELNSKSYYSNDGITTGIRKLAVNNFESAFFTKSILADGLCQQIVSLVIVLLVFVVVSCSTNRELVVLLFQLTLPVNITIEGIRYFFTFFRVKALCQSYRSLFDNNNNPRPSDILFNILNYTAALTDGKILLSETRYKRMNKSLSLEWERIKESLKIY